MLRSMKQLLRMNGVRVKNGYDENNVQIPEEEKT